MIARAAVAVLVLMTAPGARSGHAQGTGAFIPVGVAYHPADASDARRRDFEEMQRLRFNVVVLVERIRAASAAPMMFIERVLAGAPDPRVTLTPDVPPATIAVASDTTAAEVTAQAWTALARGRRGVVFQDWTTLQRNPGALVAAAEFADALTRNVTLYAPLRPVAPATDERRIRVDASGDGLDATFLESPEALVLIAINRTAGPRPARLTFSPDVPEAIWQNMLGSGAVNFVAGPDGPMYERTFAPHEVLVLMIRKKWR